MMYVKILLIAFLLFIFLFLFLVKPSETGEFVQKEKDLSKPENTKWRLIGKIYIENGKIMSVDYSNH